MAGLINYGSSEDEDDVPKQPSHERSTRHDKSATSSESLTNGSVSDDQKNGRSAQTHQIMESAASQSEGPVLGPTIPKDVPVSDLLEDGPQTPLLSPYSANRAMLRDLTLPTVPNYDIPVSPPGSPVESTNAKFKQFLKLKKQGVHFNEKLANSAAMKNPSLMQKLLDFADISEAEQYSSTLPLELWNPRSFPKYAYKEELSKSQQEILKRKEEDKSRGQRESIDFVAASASGNSSRNGTPGVGSRVAPKSAAERVMAGLDNRGRSNSPQVHGVKRKSRFDT